MWCNNQCRHYGAPCIFGSCTFAKKLSIRPVIGIVARDIGTGVSQKTRRLETCQVDGLQKKRRTTDFSGYRCQFPALLFVLRTRSRQSQSVSVCVCVRVCMRVCVFLTEMRCRRIHHLVRKSCRKRSSPPTLALKAAWARKALCSEPSRWPSRATLLSGASS